MALKNNTWKLNQWYDQDVAGNVDYSAMDPFGLYMWGKNTEGVLGQNQAPAQANRHTSPMLIPGGTWYTSSIGRGNFTTAIKSDGSMWTWGSNGDGQLGLNQGGGNNRSSPTQVPGTTWKKVGCGENHVIATKTDGTLWVWGKNSDGQLGQNNTTTYSSPIQVGSDTTWDKPYANGDNVSAIKTDGTLWAWGKSDYGQAGQNNQVYYSSPIQVGSDTTWNEVGDSSKGLVMTKTDGTLWAIGNNEDGGLGQNDTAHRSSPVQIGTSTDWSLKENAITQSVLNFVLAVKTDGTLWAWGRGTAGQLGQNEQSPSIRYSSPVQVPGTTWKTVATTYYSSIMTKTDGTLWAMGDGGQGELGQGNLNYYSSPVQIGSDATWTRTTGASQYTCIAFKEP